MNIAVIDTGTTTMKGVLFDEQGQVLFRHAISSTPRYFADGRVEQDAQVWRDTLVTLLRALADFCAQQGITLDALSLTSQRSSLIAVDAAGEAVSPTIMWQDTRTQALCDSLRDAAGLVHQTSGLPLSPVFSAVKMLWLNQHDSACYQRTAKLVGIHDYLLHHLTGQFCTDYSLASRTNLFNLHRHCWDDDLLALFQVEREKLCDLVPPGTSVGSLRPALAALTGLPTGIPVISAGGDQQCCALGMGQFSRDTLIVNVGTGAYVMGVTDSLVTPSDDPGKPRLSPHFSYNYAALPGQYIIEGSLLSACCAYDWFNHTFYPAENDYRVINQEVRAATPGGGGLVLSPFFKGRLTQPGKDKAFFYDITLNHTRGDFARAILEGIAHELNQHIQAMTPLIGTNRQIYTAGGITEFDTFNQIQADIYNLPVVAVNHNATAAGAWISAAVTLNIHTDYAHAHASVARHHPTRVFTPLPDNAQVYQALSVKSRAVQEHIY